MHSAIYRATTVIFGVAALLGAIHACGGSTSSPGATGDGGSSGSSGGLSSSCPAAPPSDGAMCPGIDLQCEYGDDPVSSCNTIARCAPGSGRWRITPPVGTAGGTCPSTLAPACPKSRAAITPGTVCTDANLRCGYASGECVCRMDCGPRYPVAMTCEAGTPLTWLCATPAAGCPAARPRLGSACTTPDLRCNYAEDDCTTPALRCDSGTWQSEPTQCARSTATKKNEIHYLDDEEVRRIAEDTNALRLTTYRYKDGDPAQHLGFIIEDAPNAAAVVKGKDRVDLYAYTSMAVATLQVQQRELEELRREVAALRNEVSQRGPLPGGCGAAAPSGPPAHAEREPHDKAERP